MPRKCCVPCCNSGYASSTTKVSTYRFPSDEYEKDKWIKAIPRKNLVVNKYTVVCRFHWPVDCKSFTSYRAKERPTEPPTVFPNIPSSCLSLPPSKPRPTKLSSFTIRNTTSDELDSFREYDLFRFDNIKERLLQNNDLIVYNINDNNVVYVQSKEFICGIAKFLVIINRDLTLTSFHLGSSCSIPILLSSKSSSYCKYWSVFDEIIRYLKNEDICHKKKILLEHMECMSQKKIGEFTYSADIITRAFEYFAISRSLYSRISNDYKLPSIRTLTRITSKVRSQDSLEFLKNVLMSIEDTQRKCVLLVDEVYIKSILTYHGGTLFGYSADQPGVLAKTMLAIKVKCLFGGPEFLIKMIPISCLDSDFLLNQCKPIIEMINNQPNAKLLSVIADGNRVNQRFFKMMNKIEGKPWCGDDEHAFLLFDFVHVMKCVRNNWLTEENGELVFEFDGNKHIAKWVDLKNLYELESGNLLKLSKLNDISISPKPIERQKVSTCLRVFCDETIAALKNHPSIKKNDVIGTIKFISIFVKFWKICNVKGVGADIRYKDEDRAVIRSHTDKSLLFLLDVADMVERMKKSGPKRVKQLSKDTSKSISHVCRGLVNMARYLLDCGNDYVILGWFTTDPLEKAFSKLRQGSGGTYFITAQSVIEKVRIQHAKLSLQLEMQCFDDCFNGHSCNNCFRRLNEQECEVFDNLPELEDKVQAESLLSIVYIAGYVQRKNGYDYTDTKFYYIKCGAYIDDLNRGGLVIPFDNIVQWCIFCFILFEQLSEEFCQSFLMKQFLSVSEKFQFGIDERHCRTLANIFLKNLAIIKSPRCSKESRQKVIKLS